MRHKTLSCHPRNYQLDSLTLLKGVHPPIFLPYHMGTVSVLKTDIKKCDNTALTTYFYIVRAVLSQIHPLFLPYLIGTVSVLKTDIKGGRLPHSIRKREGICGNHSPIYIIRCKFAGYELELKYKQKTS